MVLTKEILNYILTTSTGHLFDNNHKYYELYKTNIMNDSLASQRNILLKFYTDWFYDTYLTRRWVLELITKGSNSELLVLFHFLNKYLNGTTVFFFESLLSSTINTKFDRHELSPAVRSWNDNYILSKIDYEDISTANLLINLYNS